MQIIQEHIRRIEDVLLAQSKLAKDSNHNPSIGTLRERLLREFLKPNLPKNIDVVSGEIIDSLGNRSGQIDCILVDTTLPLVHLGSSDHLLVLAEAVLGTIEIKSHLDKRNY